MGRAFKKHDPATYHVAIAYFFYTLQYYIKKLLTILLTKPIQPTDACGFSKKKLKLYYSKWQTLHLAPAEHRSNDVANS